MAVKCRARLPLKAAQAIGIGGELSGQQLERELPPQLRVLGEVNFPHPARTQQRQHLIVTDPPSDGCGRGKKTSGLRI